MAIDRELADRIRLVIPGEMLAHQAWLLWRSEQGRKIPYCIDGRPRSGTQNAPEDLARLRDQEVI